MDLGFKGKVALVAAASQGLGKASAMAIAAEGADVAICGRNAATIEQAAEEIRQATGARVLAVQADVTRPEDIERFVAAAVAHFGRLDALVCNAGGPPPGDFADLTDAHWEQGFNLVVMPVVRLIRAALPHMEKVGGGRIAFIGSSSIKQPVPSLLLSNALRTGVQGMIKHLSAELAPKGILINSVNPGRFDTERVRFLDENRAAKAKTTTEQIRQSFAATIPLGRYGEADEFGRYVAFVVSPANTYITGQGLLIDGGLVRGY